jgi:hypothetical protein
VLVLLRLVRAWALKLVRLIERWTQWVVPKLVPLPLAPMLTAELTGSPRLTVPATLQE